MCVNSFMFDFPDFFCLQKVIKYKYVTCNSSKNTGEVKHKTIYTHIYIYFIIYLTFYKKSENIKI